MYVLYNGIYIKEGEGSVGAQIIVINRSTRYVSQLNVSTYQQRNMVNL